MFKILKWSAILLVAFVILVVVRRYFSSPVQTIPYPYYFKNKPTATIPEDTQILLLGDRMAVSLERHMPLLSQELSKELKDPIKIHSLAEEHEGLHRTLFKLKSLKKIPKIILYHGGSEEFFEKTFNTKDKEFLVKNFKTYRNPKVQTLTYLFPFLSRFVYQPIQRIALENYVSVDEDLRNYDGYELQNRQEISYLLFESQMKELMEYVLEHKSILVIITTPLNLEEPPHLTCEHAQEPGLEPELKKAQDFLDRKDFKATYNLLLPWKEKAPAHAQLFYMLGIAAKGLGNHREAITFLQYAAAFDCLPWRGGPVYNVIARQYSARYHSFVFDFENYLNDQWENEGTIFVDSLYPQELFYEKAIKALALSLKKKLKI